MSQQKVAFSETKNPHISNFVTFSSWFFQTNKKLRRYRWILLTIKPIKIFCLKWLTNDANYLSIMKTDSTTLCGVWNTRFHQYHLQICSLCKYLNQFLWCTWMILICIETLAVKVGESFGFLWNVRQTVLQSFLISLIVLHNLTNF